MSEKKTDITFRDLKNNNLIILEIKNYENTLISKKEVNQAVAYGLREKYFNNKKFKSVKLIYIGAFKEEVKEYIEKVNINLKNNEKFYIELISFNDFMQDLKENYFDNEDNKNYRRETYCFNLDTWIIENKKKGDSFISSKYLKYGEFRNNKSYIEFIADFNYDKKKLDFKEILKNEKNRNKQKEELESLNKIASKRFEK